MWIPGCSIYAVASLIFFGAWIASTGKQELQLAKMGVSPPG
jgi:hypothetical protein